MKVLLRVKRQNAQGLAIIPWRDEWCYPEPTMKIQMSVCPLINTASIKTIQFMERAKIHPISI